MTLRGRLALFYLAATAGLFLATGAAGLFAYGRGLEALADRRLMAAAEGAAELLGAAGPGAAARLGPRLDAFAEARGGLFLEVRDGADKVLYSSDPGLCAPGAAAEEPGRTLFSTRAIAGGGRLRAAAVRLPGPGGLRLDLGEPLPSPLRDLPGFTGWGAGLAALLLACAAGFAGWTVAGRALAPIGRIAATAETVAAGALGERIPRGPGRDELGRLTDVLNGMLDALEAYSKKLSRFASDVSHQLKTPLTVLRGQTEVALAGRPDAEELRTVLESNLSELETMTLVVEDILAHSRLERPGAPAPGPLHELAGRVARKASVLAGPKKQKIEARLEPAAAVFLPGKLEQALLNIVDNAVRHTPPGGVITLRTGAEQGRPFVSVEDTGPGVRPEDLPRLFDRGYSTSGTGLGLGLARELVESFSGGIAVSAAAGGGLAVRITLPAPPGRAP